MAMGATLSVSVQVATVVPVESMNEMVQFPLGQEVAPFSNQRAASDGCSPNELEVEATGQVRVSVEPAAVVQASLAEVADSAPWTTMEAESARPSPLESNR